MGINPGMTLSLTAASMLGSLMLGIVGCGSGSPPVNEADPEELSEVEPPAEVGPELTAFTVLSQDDAGEVVIGEWVEEGLTYRNPETENARVLGAFDGSALTTPSGIVIFAIDDEGRIVNDEGNPYADPGATINGRQMVFHSDIDLTLTLNEEGALVNTGPNGEERRAARIRIPDGTSMSQLSPRSAFLAYFILVFFELDRTRYR